MKKVLILLREIENKVELILMAILDEEIQCVLASEAE